MQLTVVFEHWHLGDGNYPAFRLGDEVRLSFELSPAEVTRPFTDAVPGIRQVQDAEYEVIADVIRIYEESNGAPFPVLEAG